MVVARLAGWLLGWSVDAVLWPPSWAKEGNGSEQGKEEGKREQIEPQAKRQREPSWLGLVSCGFGLVGIIDWNWMKLREWPI